MGLPLRTFQFNDNSAGLDLKSSPTKTPENCATDLLNTDYSTDGALFTRNGSTITNVTAGIPAQMVGAPRTLAMYDYKKSDGTVVQVIAAGTTIKQNLVTPVNMVTGLSALLPIPDMEFQVTLDDEYLFWGNGIDTNLKFNGTTWTNWSIVAPGAGMTATEVNVGAGALPNGTYSYLFAFTRQVAGVNVQYSDLSPITSVTVAGGPSDVQLAAIPVSADAQVTHKVIYRRSPTSGGVFYQMATITNATAAFLDVTLADGTIPAQFDNQAAPLTANFEEYLGCMNIVNTNSKTDLYESKPDLPWNVPTRNFEIFDGPILCVKRCYNVLLVATDRSIWIREGRLADGAVSKKLSSKIGILNNRCAVGEGTIYILGTNYKFYTLRPTDFANEEIRIDTPISINIEPLMSNVFTTFPEFVAMEYYTKANVSKVMVTCPIGGTFCNTLIVLNETQAEQEEAPVWEVWNNINASALKMFTIGNVASLHSGDYNGFLWLLDDESVNGDGAEENGFVTSATANTLTDTSVVLLTGTATSGGAATLTDTALAMVVNLYAGEQLYISAGTGVGQVRTILSNTADTFTVTVAWGVVPDNTSVYMVGGWRVNGFVGMVVRIIAGPGVNEFRTIVSNTPDTLTITPVWTVNPTAPLSEYTIGGYDVYHFTNWKSLTGDYNTLKQMWYFFANINASGDYNIELIIQTDFDSNPTDATIIPLNVSGGATVWGAFNWGAALWGSFNVFQERIRTFQRFYAIRIGFRNRHAGQPFQINALSISAQDKNLFYGSAP